MSNSLIYIQRGNYIYNILNINENLDELKSANGKLYWKTINMLIKNENSSNETPPLSDPQNDFKLSYESIEKALLFHFLQLITFGYL
jgi:hypothetical protein